MALIQEGNTYVPQYRTVTPPTPQPVPNPYNPYSQPYSQPYTSTPEPSFQPPDVTPYLSDPGSAPMRPSFGPGQTMEDIVPRLMEWRIQQNAYEKQAGSANKANQGLYAQATSALGPETNNTLTDIARSYIGQNRYSFGGFDCSKFTQEVASKAGVKIGRDTASQMNFFRKNGMFTRNIKNARPGDTIYFQSGASPSGRHVGIYVGHGRMIDNAGKGRPIKIRSIAGRKIIGIGRLSAMSSRVGDSAVGEASDYGWSGETGRPDGKGAGMYGLQSQMAEALKAANQAMRRDLGKGFSISSGYRSYKEQQQLRKRQPSMTSKEGTSLHGIGVAADINLDSKQRAWMKENGGKFGLEQPDDREGWHVQLIPTQWNGKWGA